jgi:hypothetical protein
MATSPTDMLSSPALTASSVESSFYMLSSQPHSSASIVLSDDPCSDDEIVWGAPDDDYIVLSRPRSPGSVASSPAVRDLVPAFSKLNLGQSSIAQPQGKSAKTAPAPTKKAPKKPKVTSKKVKKPASTTTVHPVPNPKGKSASSPFIITVFPSPAPSPSLKHPTAVKAKPSQTGAKVHAASEEAKKAKKARVIARRKARKAARACSSESALPGYVSPTPAKAKKADIKRATAPVKATPGIKVPAASNEAKKAKRARKVERRRAKKAAAEASPPATAKTELGSRPIVDDTCEEASKVTLYTEAVTNISTYGGFSNLHEPRDDLRLHSFLSNPIEGSICRLTLLQSLLVELGLCSITLLPATVTAAKVFLRTHAFINIRDYLAVRDKGQAALQSVMHPSRNALIKDIKRKKNAASLKWVKEHGLQVLLVTCHY